jgi:hypothetical protein
VKSYELLKNVFAEVGVKAIASELKVSPSLLYKWAEERDSEDAAGALNPLDRTLGICESTGSRKPIEWLCEQSNGYFVENPSTGSEIDSYPFKAVQKILRDFSQLLEVVSSSIENDDLIDSQEAEEIRSEWEDLKSKTESFVKACENGKFA